MKEIANLVSKDASLSAKVLKIANSALYNFPVKISNIHQAASRIGLNAIRSLVLSFSFLSIKAKNRKDIFDYEKFWEKSLSNAVAAKLIMAEVGKSDGEEVFIAGLLQDIGELIMANCFSQKYAQLLTETSSGEKDTIEIEEQLIGADHTGIGHEVAKMWGFPPELHIPILYHHSPQDYKDDNHNLGRPPSSLWMIYRPTRTWSSIPVRRLPWASSSPSVGSPTAITRSCAPKSTPRPYAVTCRTWSNVVC